jgi:hypothetical protein
VTIEERQRPTDSHDPLQNEQSPAALARAILQAFLESRFDALERLLHPSGAYQPEYEFAQTLDPSTALVAVSLRNEIGAGLYSERTGAYLMTFEDGLLLRNRIYDSVEEALEAHRQHTPET